MPVFFRVLRLDTCGYNPAVTTKELRDQALALPPEERARLARDIMTSLDGPSEKNAAQAWVHEIERRAQEVRTGAVKLAEWKDVRKRVLDRLTPKP